MTAGGAARPGQPDIVARFALARLRFVGSPWVRRAETPIAGISRSLGRAPRRGQRLDHLDREPTDLGYESPPGVFEAVSRRGGDRARGYPDQREVASDRRPRSRAGRAGRGLSSLPRRTAKRAELPQAAGLVRGRGWVGGGRLAGLHQAGQRRPELLSLPTPRPLDDLGARVRDRSRDLAAASGSSWRALARRPAAVRRRGVRQSTRPMRTSPARAPTWFTWRDPGSIRPTWPRSRRSPPGSTGWQRRRLPEAELWVDDIRLGAAGLADRIGAGAGRPAGRVRCRQPDRCPTSGRTASSTRSIPTRPIAPPVHFSSTPTGSWTGFSRPLSVSRCRSRVSYARSDVQSRSAHRHRPPGRCARWAAPAAWPGAALTTLSRSP